PSLGAASRVSCARSTMLGLVSFQSIATRDTLGTISRRSSSLFALNSVASNEMPVAFPPGRARLGTTPAPNRIADTREDKRNGFGCAPRGQRRPDVKIRHARHTGQLFEEAPHFRRIDASRNGIHGHARGFAQEAPCRPNNHGGNR